MAKKKVIKRIRLIRVSPLLAALVEPYSDQKGIESMNKPVTVVDTMAQTHATIGARSKCPEGYQAPVEKSFEAEVQAEDKAVPKRAAKGPRIYLDMVDDHDLVGWLHRREPKWNETFRDVFEEAREAFPNMEKLNAEHIRTRMERFADRLPKAVPPVRELTSEERIERLEKIVSLLLRPHFGTGIDQAALAALSEGLPFSI